MQQQHPDMAEDVTSKQQNLAIHNDRKASAREPDCDPEPVTVDDGVDQRGGQNGDDLERLGEFKPEEGHKYENGPVKEVGEGQSATAEDGDEGAKELEESREVEDVRPEEDAACRACTKREAEEPLEWGLGPSPEPTGVLDFRRSGEEDPGEYCDRDQGHSEVVYGRDQSQRHGPAASDEEEGEVEKYRDCEIGRDGGEQKRPG